MVFLRVRLINKCTIFLFFINFQISQAVLYVREKNPRRADELPPLMSTLSKMAGGFIRAQAGGLSPAWIYFGLNLVVLGGSQANISPNFVTNSEQA